MSVKIYTMLANKERKANELEKKAKTPFKNPCLMEEKAVNDELEF